VGGAFPERVDEGRKTWASSSIPWKNYRAWRVGKRKVFWFFEPTEDIGRMDGGTEKRDEHVPPHPFAQRLCSMPLLVPHSALDRQTHQRVFCGDRENT